MAPVKLRECVTWHKTDACFQLNQPLNVLPDNIMGLFHHPRGSEKDPLDLRRKGRIHCNWMTVEILGLESLALVFCPTSSLLPLFFAALQNPLSSLSALLCPHPQQSIPCAEHPVTHVCKHSPSTSPTSHCSFHVLGFISSQVSLLRDKCTPS